MLPGTTTVACALLGYVASIRAVAWVRDAVAVPPRSRAVRAFAFGHNLILAAFSAFVAYSVVPGLVGRIATNGLFAATCAPLTPRCRALAGRLLLLEVLRICRHVDRRVVPPAPVVPPDVPPLRHRRVYALEHRRRKSAYGRRNGMQRVRARGDVRLLRPRVHRDEASRRKAHLRACSSRSSLVACYAPAAYTSRRAVCAPTHALLARPTCSTLALVALFARFYAARYQMYAPQTKIRGSRSRGRASGRCSARRATPWTSSARAAAAARAAASARRSGGARTPGRFEPAVSCDMDSSSVRLARGCGTGTRTPPLTSGR